MLIFLVVLLAVPACRKSTESSRLTGEALGTTWSIRWRGDADPHQLQRIATRHLEHADRLFSTWREDSVISRLNRNEPIELSPEFTHLLERAEAISNQSGGAFNPRLGQAVAKTGFGGSALDPATSDSLDLSGIVKGWVVDQIRDEIRATGVDSALIEVGGEIAVFSSGESLPEEGWKIGLEAPSPIRRELGRRIRLSQGAVATSGTYRQRSGTRSHLVEPRTGHSPQGLVSSVVFAADCTEADAWATALAVLPREGALELAREQRINFLRMERLPDGTLQVDEIGEIPAAE